MGGSERVGKMVGRGRNEDGREEGLNGREEEDRRDEGEVGGGEMDGKKEQGKWEGEEVVREMRVNWVVGGRC